MLFADKIAVAGDWHGTTMWAEQCLVHAHNAGIKYVLHAGDFGVWPIERGGAAYLDKLQHVLEHYDQVLAVTPGNHEDYDQIAAVKPTDTGDGFGLVKRIRPRILLLPRGHRFAFTTANGTTRTVVSLGGGPSLDFENRLEGHNFWKAEAITQMDVLNTIDGGFADIMVAHDAPGAPYQTPGVADICESDEWGWSTKALTYAREQRYLMTQAFEGVCPKLFVHGHYHTRSTAVIDTPAGTPCRIISLPKQRQAGNIIEVDLDTLEFAGITNPPGF